MALAPLSQTIFLTEDGSTVRDPKPVTIPPLVAVPPVTLGTLTLSDTLTAGTPSSGSVNGATAGSMITDAITGLTVDSQSRTYEWDGSGQPGTNANGLTETHWNATNSGRTSPVTIVAAPAASTVTIDSLVRQSGNDYFFIARRDGDTSKAVSRQLQVAASTDYLPRSRASDWPGGVFPTVTVNFPAGSPTAPFTITAPAAARPE